MQARYQLCQGPLFCVPVSTGRLYNDDLTQSQGLFAVA